MKKCTYCGLENPDEAAMCSTCHTAFGTEPSPTLQPPLSREYLMSAEEQGFWKQLSVRQIIIVILRTVGLWLLFVAALQAINLVPFLSTMFQLQPYIPITSQLGSALWLVLLRIALYIVAGMILLRYTEKLLGWLVKDLVAKTPPNAPPPNPTQA